MNTVLQLEARKLGCKRQGRQLFTDLSFQLKATQALIVEGENGAGKSSLLRLIAGIATPTDGNIFFAGQDIHLSLCEYTEHMHYISHANGIKLGLTVSENIQLTCDLAEQGIKNIDDVLSALKLLQHKDTQAQFLSAGQKRRIALARLFLLPRKLWVLDEPFTSLDIDTQQLLKEKISAHLKHGGMCVLTSHQPVELTADVSQMRLGAC